MRVERLIVVTRALRGLGAGLTLVALGSLPSGPPAVAQQSGSNLQIIGSTDRLEWTETRYALQPFERPVRNHTDGYTPTVASSSGAPLPTLWTAPVEIVWEFGDGSPPVSTGERVSVAHYYEDEGSYTIRVTAADSNGVFAEGRHQVKIGNRDPHQVWAKAAPAIGVARGIDFAASAQDAPGDTLTYQWEFGDGKSAEGEDLRQVRHVYSSPGDFEVTLTVRDEDGGEEQKTLKVRVRGVVESGTPPEPSDPEKEPETIVDGLKGRMAGALSADLDAQVRSLRGLYLSPVSSGACRFMFTAWDDALLAYALVLVDFPTLRSEGGKYRFSPPQVTLTFEPDAEAYLFHRQRGLGARAIPGVGAMLEGLLGEVPGPAGERWRERMRDEVGVDPRAREPQEAEPIPAVSPFGIDEAARLSAAGGTFDLTFRPRRYALGKLDVSLRSDPDGPLGGAQVALQNVAFALDLNAAMRDGMFNYDCGDGTFEIDDREPAPDSQHGWSLRPPVRASFDKRVDPTSFTDDTFQLVHPDAAGRWVRAEGRFLVGKYSTTFVPDERLKPGVRYTVRVRTGEEGVRALDGSELDDIEGDGWQRWSFTTPLDFAPAAGGADQLLACHLFQTVRDPRLIVGKPALARVWASWPRHPDVLPEAQVRDFEARVILTNRKGEPLATSTKRFVRPDLWATRGIETRSALHTAQVFGFTPEEGLELPVRVRLEVPTDPGKTRRRYATVCPAEIWDRKPVVTVEYFALKLFEWSTEEAFDTVKPALEEIIRQAEIYAEQLFPVADVRSRGIGALEVPLYTRLVQASGVTLENWRRAYQKDLWQLSSADIVVLLLPHRELSGGQTSERTLREGRAAIAFAASARSDYLPRYVNGLVHEIGHAMSLQHLPYFETPEEQVRVKALRDSGAQQWFEGIEGFRMSPAGTSGWNKSSTEGNEEEDRLVPLMYGAIMPPESAFIAHHHYLELQRLFDEIGD